MTNIARFDVPQVRFPLAASPKSSPLLVSPFVYPYMLLPSRHARTAPVMLGIQACLCRWCAAALNSLVVVMLQFSVRL